MSGITVFLSGGGIFLSLFGAGLLLAAPGGRRKADGVLALLLVLCSITIAHPLLGQFLLLSHGSRPAFLIEPFQFLMGPLIAAYVWRLTVKDSPWRARHLVHGIPFVAVIGFAVSPLPALMDRGAAIPVSSIALWALLSAQVLAYDVCSLTALHRYRAALRQQKSNIAGIDLGWLDWFEHALVALYLCYLVILALMVHRVNPGHIRGFLSIALSAYACILAFRGLTQKETPVLDSLEPLAGPPPLKYRKAGMPEEEAVRVAHALEQAMERERLFLDPELDLSGLAERVGAARNQLSFVINQHLGKNFYDFVNEYRVREAVRLMEDPARSNDKILSIALDAGFNSKPTFNAVFRKVTGRTPSDFRRTTKKVV